MEGSPLACQADDCNYDKLKHDTAHREFLMKAFIGWSTKQRQHSHSPSMFCKCMYVYACVWECREDVCDLMCVCGCVCVCIPVHLCECTVIEKNESSVRDVTLKFVRVGFTAYRSVGYSQEKPNLGNRKKSGWS